jgi:hypothetical protein
VAKDQYRGTIDHALKLVTTTWLTDLSVTWNPPRADAVADWQDYQMEE